VDQRLLSFEVQAVVQLLLCASLEHQLSEGCVLRWNLTFLFANGRLGQRLPQSIRHGLDRLLPLITFRDETCEVVGEFELLLTGREAANLSGELNRRLGPLSIGQGAQILYAVLNFRKSVGGKQKRRGEQNHGDKKALAKKWL
jgi:hypothetical protein